MEQKILDKINEAEMILVGIGEEFSPAYPKGRDGDELEPYRKSRFYDQLPGDHEVIRAYCRLRELIGAKPYFVVTMNTDDLIYRSDLENDLIVAPCGSMGKLQCGTHIVEAGEIRDRVLETGDTGLALCPKCGRPLQFHTAALEDYQEEGYLPQWEKYKKWLQCTLNRRLCILELGVGFRYPQIIRWPFEKTAFYNQKAFLIRVHSTLWQLTEEIGKKGIAVRESPVKWLNK